MEKTGVTGEITDLPQVTLKYYDKIMKIMRWATILPISTKRTFPQTIEYKNTTTYNVENIGHGLGQAHTCGGVKQADRIQSISTPRHGRESNAHV